MMPVPAMLKVTASRILAVLAVVLLVGMLPWLSGRSAEYTILRGRYAELEATPEALATVRAELGLDRGPLSIFGSWLAGVLRGDFGASWVSNTAVGPGILAALGISLTLMAAAMVVALLVCALMCLPILLRSGVAHRGTGALAAALTALPEFLLAAGLLVVGAVWLGWFPPFGWQGPRNVVLPAISLGIPAGGLLGRLLVDALAGSYAEHWVQTWRMAGFSRPAIACAVMRRSLPSVVSQGGLVIIGLTGGAVAVEKIYAIPGLGRATLGAAAAQDIPTLQAGILALLGVAACIGIAGSGVRLVLLGPALRAGTMPIAGSVMAARGRDHAVPVVAGGLLAAIIGLGLLRDPFTSAHARLAAPSWALPFGADASGRDLLARVGHGAVSTVGMALLVVVACLLTALVVGMFPLAATGPLEVANAAPPILAGLVVAAVAGPSAGGAAAAVALVSWAPLAAHTAALAQEVRAQPHIQILPVLGVGRGRMMWRYILVAVAGPVARHAALRLPGTALALASLGFLGLGPGQPTPEWGLILAEGIGYVERAPWAVLAPSSALVLASMLAVSLSSLGVRGSRSARSESGRAGARPIVTGEPAARSRAGVK
ncbi:ABC transporter permease subunit [Pseudarthrobacter sp. PS3-L1]|uniref:ABC transporter permease subunit n=1 Tax=Pseudarthrobacter sp. PS3-L1 TaxID=3046207 RepID=UPI0032D941E9